jgi:predicted transcriptional regulator
MESIKQRTEVRILEALYSKNRLYASQLAREVNLTVRHVDRVLPKMANDNLIKIYKERNKKYCEITEKGRALAWALLHPEDLAALFVKEETARSMKEPELLSIKKLLEEEYSSILPIEVSRLETSGNFIELAGKIPKKALEKLRGAYEQKKQKN